MEIEMPTDEAAELIVLGYLTSAKQPMAQLYSTPISADDFSNLFYSAMFEALSEQFKGGAKRANLTALSHYMARHPSFSGRDAKNEIKKVMGHHYGLEATKDAVDRIKAASVRRSVILTLKTQLARCSNPANDIMEIISDTMKPLAEATTTRSEKKVVDQQQATGECWEEIMAAIDHQGECMGVPTPFAKLNWLTSGLFLGDYGILAGRPGTGKTAMALNLAYNAAQNGYPVLFFSLEMPRTQLLKRMVATRMRIDARKFRGIGKFTPEEVERLNSNLIDEIAALPIRHYDFPAIKPYQLRAICQAEKQSHGIKLVIVDYVGLVHPEKRTGQRHLDVGEVSEALRCTAKELNVHILALAQMNRNIDGANRDPFLSDLRESGNLEQDTDNVWFLHNGEGGQDGDALKPIILKVAKNRHGPEGKVNLWFEREFLAFKEQVEDYNA